MNLFKGGKIDYQEDYLFNYIFGISITFDRAQNLEREYFIPYYGIKSGGIYLNSLGVDYNGFVVLPFLGISIMRTKEMMLNIDVSIMLSSLKFREFLSVSPNLIFSFVL